MSSKKLKNLDFDEIVEVSTDDPEKKKYNNMRGYIVGKSYNEADDFNPRNRWYCLVQLFDIKHALGFYDYELESTGEFVPEGFDETGETIKVVVNEKGEGHLKED